MQKKYRIKKFGPITKRRDYSNTVNDFKVLDLLKITKESYKKFLEKDIDEIINDIYPIESNNKKIKIEFIKKRLEFPKNEHIAVKEAKQKSKNYSIKLYGTLRKINNETGESQSQEVLFCEIPYMTNGGTFIINGIQKVIISQLVKSPGVYYQKEARMSSKESLYNIASLNPFLGSWLKIFHNVTSKNIDVIKLKIDKSKNIKLNTLLRAFGLTKEGIINLFGLTKELEVTFKKENDKLITENDSLEYVYQLLHPGDRITEEGKKELFANLFFNKKRYNLSNIGRYTLNRKLNLIDRLVDCILAEDLVTKTGTVLFKKNTLINLDMAKEIQKAFDNKTVEWTRIPDITPAIYGKQIDTPIGKKLKKRLFVPIVKVYPNALWAEKGKVIKVIGNDSTSTEQHLLMPDLIAIISYYFGLIYNIGFADDEDSLVNKRVRVVGELLKNQLRIGFARMLTNARERLAAKNIDNITPKNITNNKPINSQIKLFFNSSKLSHFMDQMNPLSEMSNKRRISALPPGIVSSRENVPFSIRNVHSTHYGRICPIESPEGPNIGLVLNFATHAQIDEYGFIQTPYFKVENTKVIPKVVYLTAIEEINKKIAQSHVKIKDGKLVGDNITIRTNSEYVQVPASEVEYIDVASNQFTSIAASAIPFLENDDANRALMGANMQRQAVPLIQAESPLVATGIECEIAKYSASNLTSNEDGEIVYVDADTIKLKNKNNKIVKYNLRTFERSNQGSVITQKPIVKVGQKIKKGDLLVDGPSFKNGELSIGKNILVAFSTWNGYNYEDAIVLSERLFKKDVFTSIHIETYSIQFHKLKIGDDKLTSSLPNVSNHAKRFLDSNGIVTIGSEVRAGDVLVGRVSPKGETNQSPEEKLIAAIFSERNKNVKDTSLKVSYGKGGTVIDVEILSRENGDKLDDGIDKIVKVYIAQKRKIKVGDKMAGRHGNKGVVSIVLPEEDMPHLPDGTPVDMLLNPLGVPSRMNIGQVLELHLGIAAKTLKTNFVTQNFDGLTREDIIDVMNEAKLPKNGKFTLIDPISGNEIDQPVALGYMYMIKLSHMVDDKMHARSVGPYSLISQQPLGGKSQNGGQRFGEMETWAIESYGATNILQEMLTYKSDDIFGRNRLYNAIANDIALPQPGIPESFNVLSYELRGLCLKPEELVDNDDENNKDNVNYEGDM